MDSAGDRHHGADLREGRHDDQPLGPGLRDGAGGAGRGGAGRGPSRQPGIARRIRAIAAAGGHRVGARPRLHR
ncbi:hypothetical protein MTBLM5_10094 [Magnetospirillum sp. LM-5]|nr:hypothetical protein MTBLM5_10094 [Magnetospirillum sp. LM-5]